MRRSVEEEGRLCCGRPSLGAGQLALLYTHRHPLLTHTHKHGALVERVRLSNSTSGEQGLNYNLKTLGRPDRRIQWCIGLLGKKIKWGKRGGEGKWEGNREKGRESGCRIL